MKPHYERMAQYLWLHEEDTVSLSFDEIERIVAGKLPENTKRRPESWSNNPGGFGMTRAWLAAGYKQSRLDVAGQRVTFKRANQGIPDACWRRVVAIALGIDLPTK